MDTDTSAIDIEFRVKAGEFEGPLDLLLSLIEKRKLFINEISLADVTGEYLTYIKSLGSYNLSNVTSFVVIAATLLLVKSRSLLPNLELSTEEEKSISSLEDRLKIYETISYASLLLKKIYLKTPIYSPLQRKNEEVIFSPHPSISKESLLISLNEVLNKVPKTDDPLPEIIVQKVFSIDEMINDLTARIQNSLNMKFSEFAKHPSPENEKENKVYIIVSFLAMLELVREGIVDVLQQNEFHDMTIEKINPQI
jgi:segregation and condensation protein A